MVSRRVFLIVLVLSALLPARAFSASDLQVHCIVNPSAAVDLGTCVSESIALSSIGLLLSLSIVALTFMVGEVLNMGNLKGWYRRELWETTKSALLVAVIYSLLVILGGMGAALAGGGQSAGTTLLGGSAFSGSCLGSTSSPFSTSGTPLASNLATLYNVATISYIQPTLCYAYGAFAAILGLTTGVRTAKSVVLTTYFPLEIIPWPPFLFFAALQFGSNAYIFQSTFLDAQVENPTFSFLYLVLRTLILPILLMLQFQLDLLPALMAVGFGVFLPLGIILRGTPFLRPIGGTILAIAIGVTIVYPVVLVTLNLPITDYFVGLTAGSASAPSEVCASGGIGCLLLGWIIGPSMTLMGMPMQLAIGSIWTNDLNIQLNTVNAAKTGFWDYTLLLGHIFPALNLVDKYALLLVVQLVLTAIDILIGVATVQAIAKSLGGTLRLSVGRRFRIA